MTNKRIKAENKSYRLNETLRNDIRNAMIIFCFKNMNDIFLKLMQDFCVDFYFATVDKRLYKLYKENTEVMEDISNVTNRIDSAFTNGITISGEKYRKHIIPRIVLPVAQPAFSSSFHVIKPLLNPTNKKQYELNSRFSILNSDLILFKKRVSDFENKILKALSTATTTKVFIEENPELEGYMKQSLKKYFASEHTEVIESLKNGMDIRQYASVTNGHRLQAYQKLMLEQLQTPEQLLEQPVTPEHLPT